MKRLADVDISGLAMQANETSKRVEYRGELLKLVESIADIPAGGQILCDGTAFNGIKSNLVQIREMLQSQPDLQNAR